MSWNECLYHYHTQVGGQYFGNNTDINEGLLFLTHRDMPMVLSANVRSNTVGRGNTFRLCAYANVTLERAYELRIRDEGMTSKGLGTIRNLVPSQSDFGQPELARKRNIGASDHAFTKLVLQDLDLRNQLEQNKKMKITVLPTGKDGTTHLVTVYQQDDLTWSEAIVPFTVGEMLQDNQKDGVVKYLNQMLDLCYYACRAVQAYRMPTE